MQKTERGTVLSIVSEGVVIRGIWNRKVLLLFNFQQLRIKLKCFKKSQNLSTFCEEHINNKYLTKFLFPKMCAILKFPEL